MEKFGVRFGQVSCVNIQIYTGYFLAIDIVYWSKHHELTESENQGDDKSNQEQGEMERVLI